MDIPALNPQTSPKNEQKKRRKAYLKMIASNKIDQNSAKHLISSLPLSLENALFSLACFSRISPPKLSKIHLSATPHSSQAILCSSQNHPLSSTRFRLLLLTPLQLNFKPLCSLSLVLFLVHSPRKSVSFSLKLFALLSQKHHTLFSNGKKPHLKSTPSSTETPPLSCSWPALSNGLQNPQHILPYVLLSHSSINSTKLIPQQPTMNGHVAP